MNTECEGKRNACGADVHSALRNWKDQSHFILFQIADFVKVSTVYGGIKVEV